MSSGAIVLFIGLLLRDSGRYCSVHDAHWAPRVWLTMGGRGIAVMVGFPRPATCRGRRRGGMPLIDLSLLAGCGLHARPLAPHSSFFFANLSFYLVMTLFMQKGAADFRRCRPGWCFVPLALTFIIASRVQRRAGPGHRGTLVLIEGCAIQIAGLAMLASAIASLTSPGAALLALVLTVFGFGQGLVMAPLSGAWVLSTVKAGRGAGSGSGLYGTTAQIANAAGDSCNRRGVSSPSKSVSNTQHALFAALAIVRVIDDAVCVVFLTRMRRGRDVILPRRGRKIISQLA